MNTNNQTETNLDNEKILYRDLAYQVIGFAMKVHSTLGPGFLEKVYENAMMVLLKQSNLETSQQTPLAVYFEGQQVGEYFADILVEHKIIIELKTVEQISDTHRAQALNYLKATSLRLALIINFGNTRLEYERLIN